LSKLFRAAHKPNPIPANTIGRPESQVPGTALDWMAVAAEEHGREILEVYLQAMRVGDWRAAEALMSRIYGKPEAALAAHVPPHPMIDLMRSMSLDGGYNQASSPNQTCASETRRAPPTA
jgi:hypothetical protein